MDVTQRQLDHDHSEHIHQLRVNLASQMVCQVQPSMHHSYAYWVCVDNRFIDFCVQPTLPSNCDAPTHNNWPLTAPACGCLENKRFLVCVSQMIAPWPKSVLTQPKSALTRECIRQMSVGLTLRRLKGVEVWNARRHRNADGWTYKEGRLC